MVEIKQLTERTVLQYRAGPKRRLIRDAKATSLFLVIQPSGHKSWQMRFRVPSRKQPAKLTLGSLHASAEPPGAPTIGMPLTLAGARMLAAEVHRQRALGRDPAADNAARRARHRSAAAEGASNTFGAAAENFIEKYASKKVRRWKEQARLLGFHPTDAGLELIAGGLAQRWGNRQTADIDGHDVHTVVAETRERGAPGLQRRGDGPTEARARAMLSALSRMFRWLVEHRRVDSNPCAGVHRPAAPLGRDRVLTNAEIAKFWIATEKVAPQYCAVLRLLLLTGCRLNEIAALRWEELSAEQINLPGTRTKNHRPHVVPLAPLAREIIDMVPHIEGSPYVFSLDGKVPISVGSKIKRRLDAAMDGAPHWRIHDLRRTVVTGMAELGIRPDVIELCVNHVSGHRGGIAGVYNKAELLPERSAALARWSQHVASIVSLQEKEKVVALPARRRS